MAADGSTRRLDQEDRMLQARPTRAPAGRLLRLSLVLNPLAPQERLVEVARMGDRAGIGALWVSDVHPLDRRPAATDPFLAVSLVAPVARRSQVGLMLTPAPGSADDVAAMTGTLQEELSGRLEVGLRLGRLGPIALEAYIAALRRRWSTPDPPVPTVSLQTELGPSLAPAVRAADDAVLVAGTLEEVEELARETRAACAAAGRAPTTLGLAVELPVSIGRTAAEAWARWESDEALAGLGPPAEVAIFGTLEQSHEQVIRLAHAGVTDLRCVLPETVDVHDVIAQLTALSIGTVDVLAPGSPRSRAPEPPKGWGGRPRFPTT
jgi:alkanesulfonate monooxygenase SsuD/methylene tetrahydromethanopterin reductase-like flavin-dependent oxidoreductase (luciferase family)